MDLYLIKTLIFADRAVSKIRVVRIFALKTNIG